MQVWKGWTAAGETPMIKVPSWEEWLAHQLQRVRQAEYHVRQDVQFSEHEMARLMFLRWLHLAGRLDHTSATASERESVTTLVNMRLLEAEFRHVGWHDTILTDQHEEGDTSRVWIDNNF